jgi:hypothetical protein
MKTPARVLAFGLISGLVWSFAVVLLFQHNQLLARGLDLPGMLVAGAISGVATSAILAPILRRAGGGWSVFSGLLSLPIGAFLFGFSCGLFSHLFPEYSSGNYASISPWMLGCAFAAASVATAFALVFLPLAVATTYLLRAYLNLTNKVAFV